MAQSTNNKKGIFQNILKVEGTPQKADAVWAAIAGSTPETAIIYQALQLLPEGELKSWLTSNPIDMLKRLWTVIVGRKYTKGEYTLGERLNDQVYCNGDIGQGQVSDDIVELAKKIFCQLFGVRLSSMEDLDALQNGMAAYRARPVSQGISDNAIERAVYLKQNYFPDSMYNRACWDLRYFEIYPLVDRIPDPEIGRWYTGEVLGGAYARDGVIPVNADDFFDQYIGADFDPNTGNTTLPDGTVITPGDQFEGGAGGGGNVVDQVVNWVKKADALTLAAIAAAGYYVYTEIEDEL